MCGVSPEIEAHAYSFTMQARAIEGIAPKPTSLRLFLRAKVGDTHYWFLMCIA